MRVQEIEGLTAFGGRLSIRKVREDSNMKRSRMPVDSLRGVNEGFWCHLGPVQTSNVSRAELNSNLDRPKLSKVRLLIQASNLT